MQHPAFALRQKTPHPAGFTLLEMLVTVAIAALMLIAAPSLARILQQQRVSNEINMLLTHLHLARSETQKRGMNVVLCRSRDGNQCSVDGRWHDGWIVFADPNDNERRDNGEEIIRSQQALPPHLHLRLGTTTDRVHLRYAPNGSATNLTFILCDRSGRTQPRAIIVFWTGRARVSNRDSENRALTCA